MEAKNFRVGNFIKDTWSKMPFVITSLGKQIATYNGAQEFKCRYENLEPIEITEQWLFDLGFEKETKGSVSNQYNYGENPLTHEYLLQLIWLKTLPDYELEKHPFYRNGHFSIKYVHQLQNLFFALTGTELTVKHEVSV